MAETITIQKLEKEVESLKKKIFIYETLHAEKEIKTNSVLGPFKTGEELIEYLKK